MAALALVGTTLSVSLSGCTSTPPDIDGDIRIRYPGGHRIVDGDELHKIDYKGFCLLQHGESGLCTPCDGGKVRPCEDWYDIIDELREREAKKKKAIESAAGAAGEGGEFGEAVVPSGGANTQRGGGTRPGVQFAPVSARPVLIGGGTIHDPTLKNTFLEILSNDGVDNEHDAIMAEYGLDDYQDGEELDVRAAFTELDDIEDTGTIVFIVRSDFQIPHVDQGATVDMYVHGDIDDGPMPALIRVSGDLSAVIDACEPILGIGSDADFVNELGAWTFATDYSTSEGYHADVTLNGIYVGAW